MRLGRTMKSSGGKFFRASLYHDTLVLRDFHADNLMWLPERDGVAACGLLDFQDALAGPPAYDLMSLWKMPAGTSRLIWAKPMIDRYLTAFPGIKREAFMTSFSILAAQRHCKVIGIFTRLAVRDGKPEYLAHIPRVWRLLENICARSDLAPLKTWLERWLPAEKRNLHTSQPPRHDRNDAKNRNDPRSGFRKTAATDYGQNAKANAKGCRAHTADHSIDHLVDGGIEKVVINIHHLGGPN